MGRTLSAARAFPVAKFEELGSIGRQRGERKGERRDSREELSHARGIPHQTEKSIALFLRQRVSKGCHGLNELHAVYGSAAI